MENYRIVGLRISGARQREEHQKGLCFNFSFHLHLLSTGCLTEKCFASGFERIEKISGCEGLRLADTFPNLGNFSSKHWKNRIHFFQTL